MFIVEGGIYPRDCERSRVSSSEIYSSANGFFFFDSNSGEEILKCTWPFHLNLPSSSFSVKVSRVTVDSILIHGKLISKSLKLETNCSLRWRNGTHFSLFNRIAKKVG